MEALSLTPVFHGVQAASTAIVPTQEITIVTLTAGHAQAEEPALTR